LLPDIELAAATLLRGHAPPSVLRETTSEPEFAAAQRAGRLWVALADEAPVGFSHAEALGSGEAYLKEIDVHPHHGRRGLGRQLIATVFNWAARSGYPVVTLTTFRDVPWNMPFYARLGFAVTPASEWSSDLRDIVQAEARLGLDPVRRVVMRRSTAIHPSNAARTGWPMQADTIELLDDAQCQQLEPLLVERMYEFNSKVTGYFDAMLLGARVRNSAGEMIAGLTGYTWGGCAKISHLWVRESQRGRGRGTALLHAAEAEALRRGCSQVVLSTHSFQAPGFYERMGYQPRYAVEGRPRGYSNILFLKSLTRS
jgi:GNAT superfamily N-acetyltransferase